jgi:hypothetical protein
MGEGRRPCRLLIDAGRFVAGSIRLLGLQAVGIALNAVKH